MQWFRFFKKKKRPSYLREEDVLKIFHLLQVPQLILERLLRKEKVAEVFIEAAISELKKAGNLLIELSEKNGAPEHKDTPS